MSVRGAPRGTCPAADLKRKTVDFLGKCRVSLTGSEPLNLTVLRLPISLSTMQLATCRRPERDSDKGCGLRLSMRGRGAPVSRTAPPAPKGF